MARRKKPENETPEEAKLRLQLESIANHANRSEKTAWKRKLNNMEGLIEKLHPIEEEILKILSEKKQPLLDEIAELRALMVKDCIHPYEHLIMKEDGFVECKFCGKKLKVTDAS
jgi:predicted  nucleic acid-binding Zn-ribbon protein